MFTWSENYFMETTMSFGILTICSDWSLCTMLLQQYALRLLICLPNGAGGEILYWAVRSWRAGTMSYSSCISSTVFCSLKLVDKYWMKESWCTWTHSLIPWHKISPPLSALYYFPVYFSSEWLLSTVMLYVVVFIIWLLLLFSHQNLNSLRVGIKQVWFPMYPYPSS